MIVTIVATVLVPATGNATDVDLRSRLDSRLVAIAQNPAELPTGVPERNGRIDVDVFPDPDGPPGILRALAAIGGGDIVEVGDMISLSLPAAAIGALGGVPGVEWARVAAQPVPESVTGEQIAAIDANDWHAAGTTGGGVKIAVIDSGFTDRASAITSGDLPTRLVSRNYCSGGMDGSGLHGTAVAEVVHETAPDALLHLVCIENLGDLTLATDWAVDQGIDVIVHSIGWFPPGRGDGAGPLATIVTTARDAGILWVNSAGNYAGLHWLGSFADTTANGINEFSGTDERLNLDVASNSTVRVYLRWDDWPASDIDYDLRLYRGPTLVASSTDLQSGTQPPQESVSYTTGVSSQTLGIEIVKVSGTGNPTMDLFVLGALGDIEYPVAAMSISDPATSDQVAAIGAAWVGDGSIEDFSSNGPTIDGRIKPDLTAPDGVSNHTYGTFPGTSAAAPAAAGAAGLLRQAGTCPTPSTLQADLMNHVSDAGAAGPDPVYGAGLLVLGTPPTIADPVVRRAGADRFSTATAISAADVPCGSTVAFVAVGSNYPDALAGAAAAGRLGAPVLLVDQTSVPQATDDELTRLAPDTIVILGGTAVISADVETALSSHGTVIRLAGPDRYSTSVAVSQYAFPAGADTVIVATGLSYADALSGGPAAVHLGAPVLLTDPSSLPVAVADEITRLAPSTIYVLGGPAAVSDAVVAELDALAPTSRIFGPDRFSTSAAISSAAFPDGAARAYVAVGTNFPDALAGAAVAGFYDGPVVLVQQDALPQVIEDEITRLGVSQIIILGGTAAVSSAVEAALEALVV